MVAQIYEGLTVLGLNQNVVYTTGLPASLQQIVDASAVVDSFADLLRMFCLLNINFVLPCMESQGKPPAEWEEDEFKGTGESGIRRLSRPDPNEKSIWDAWIEM